MRLLLCLPHAAPRRGASVLEYPPHTLPWLPGSPLHLTHAYTTRERRVQRNYRDIGDEAERIGMSNNTVHHVGAARFEDVLD